MTSKSQFGSLVILRDESGKAIHKVLGGDGVKPKVTARAALRKLTNNGLDLYLRLYDISMGKAHVVKLDDGRETEPMVPSIDVQRQAAKDLIEFMHGKAVAQTEIIKADEQHAEQEQLQAMSDDQLWALVHNKTKELTNAEPQLERLDAASQATADDTE